MFKIGRNQIVVPFRNMLVPAHGLITLTNLCILEPTDEYRTFIIPRTLTGWNILEGSLVNANEAMRSYYNYGRNSAFKIYLRFMLV